MENKKYINKFGLITLKLNERENLDNLDKELEILESEVDFKNKVIELVSLFHDLEIILENENLSWTLEYQDNNLIKYIKILKNKNLEIKFINERFSITSNNQNKYILANLILEEVNTYERLKEMNNKAKILKMSSKL